MKKHNKIIILASLVIIIYLIFLILMHQIATLNPHILIFDMELFYSPTTFYNNLQLYTNTIKLYLLIFRIFDMFFPLVYSLLLVQLIKQYHPKLIVLPLTTLFLDLLENSLLAYKMFINQTYNENIVYLLNAVTSLKFLTLIISIIIVLYAVLKAKKDKGL